MVEELEFQLNDRRSFEEFVGLGVMNSIPDATTVVCFRERLRIAGVIEELFEMFETFLRSQGLQTRGWRIRPRPFAWCKTRGPNALI